MTITLTPQESEEYFYNALCNGAGYIQGYGSFIDYNADDYKKVRAILHKKDQGVCIEDILMEMLRQGYSLTWKDEEGEDAYTRKITLKDVHERVAKTPLEDLTAMIEERDDAATADMILQTVFLEEIIFG